MMSKCTENSNTEYDSRDITMSNGGKKNAFILIKKKDEKKFLTTIRLTGPFCLFVLHVGSGDHSLGAGDQIPSQQTRQLKSLQISDTNKGMSATPLLQILFQA